MNDSSPQPPKLRPHQLCGELALRLAPGERVLELGSGRGRNTGALLARGVHVDAVPDDEVLAFSAATAARFDAVLSTHGLLHGHESDIARLVRQTSAALRPGGLFFAVFGSQRDARFGRGERLSDKTYAPETGEERGIAHTYFTQDQLQALLGEWIEAESMDECAADAGAWAHAQPLQGHVHWFVRGVRR